jgi:hypothetical protein
MTQAKTKSRNKILVAHVASPAKGTFALTEKASELVEVSWLESLTPEELALEAERQLSRQKKADVMKQRQELEQIRYATEERERKQAELKGARQEARQGKAKQEEKLHAEANGILEARQHADGVWYVALGSGLWKEVDHHFWCRHCEAGMSEAAIASHLVGQRHCKRLAANPKSHVLAPDLPGPCTLAVCGDNCGVSPTCLETWQELLSDGEVRCILCNKCCNGVHETTPEHAKKVFAYLATLEGDYKEPDEPWLSWLPCKEWGEGLFLKCLLCDKWIQDLVGTDPRGYDGHHGSLSSKNQKGHSKKIQNLDESMRDKGFWAAMRAPVAVKPLSIESPLTAQQPPAPKLPEGWQATWSEEHDDYYFHSDMHESQWELPIDPAAETSAGSSCSRSS